MKLIYKAPSIKVVSFKVEEGFAGSGSPVEVAPNTGTEQLQLIDNSRTPWYQAHQQEN